MVVEKKYPVQVDTVYPLESYKLSNEGNGCGLVWAKVTLKTGLKLEVTVDPKSYQMHTKGKKKGIRAFTGRITVERKDGQRHLELGLGTHTVEIEVPAGQQSGIMTILSEPRH